MEEGREGGRKEQMKEGKRGGGDEQTDGWTEGRTQPVRIFQYEIFSQ